MTGKAKVEDLIEGLKAERLYLKGYPYSYGTNMVGIWFENQYHVFQFSNQGEFSQYFQVPADVDLLKLLTRNGEYPTYAETFIGDYQNIPYPIDDLKMAVIKLREMMDQWRKSVNLRYKLNNLYEFAYAPLVGFVGRGEGRPHDTGILGVLKEDNYRLVAESTVLNYFFQAIYRDEPIERISLNDDFALEMTQREELLKELKPFPEAATCLVYITLSRTIYLWLDQDNRLYEFNLSKNQRNYITRYPTALRDLVLRRYRALFFGRRFNHHDWLEQEFTMLKPEKKAAPFDRALLNYFSESGLQSLLNNHSFVLSGGLDKSQYVLNNERLMESNFSSQTLSPVAWLNLQINEDAWIHFGFD